MEGEAGREGFYQQKLKRSDCSFLGQRALNEQLHWAAVVGAVAASQRREHAFHQALQTPLRASTHKVALYPNPQHIVRTHGATAKKLTGSSGVCALTGRIANLYSHEQRHHEQHRGHNLLDLTCTKPKHGMWDGCYLQVTGLSVNSL